MSTIEQRFFVWEEGTMFCVAQRTGIGLLLEAGPFPLRKDAQAKADELNATSCHPITQPWPECVIKTGKPCDGFRHEANIRTELDSRVIELKCNADELRAALKWALPLVETALEQCRHRKT